MSTRETSSQHFHPVQAMPSNPEEMLRSQGQQRVGLVDPSTRVSHIGLAPKTRNRSRRSFRHWTPTYVRDRIALEFRQRQRPDEPWLTAPAVAIIASWLRESDTGIEWGSGRSTLWFAARVARLISIEHNETWYTKTSNELHDRGLATRTDIRLCLDGRDGGPTSSYVRIASEIESESLDFALVDGVARDHCALAALSLLKPGGLLVIDNINRFIPRCSKSRAPGSRSLSDGFESDEWLRFSEHVDAWRLIWTTDGVCDTALWVKPGDNAGRHDDAG